MSVLSLYLPPFASDYAGAASALFDLDCLVAINDGSCCTSHFASYDEPRWSTERKQTLCTNLRMNDTIFGIDERIVDQLGVAAHDLQASRIVALGTPVPAVIGTDMQGLAADLAESSGIPAVGIDTTGFDTYEAGILKVFDLLEDEIDAPCAAAGTAGARVVNILGMTPLDYGADNSSALEELLCAQDFTVQCNFFMGAHAHDFKHAGEARANIAVSYAGVVMAERLKKRFGTPYVASSFMSAATIERAIAALASAGAPCASAPCTHADKDILIVADQVIGNTLRETIEATIPAASRIRVASFFGIHPACAREGDAHLPHEEALVQHLNAVSYDLIIGDPLLYRVPRVKQTRFLPLVHPAVSSRLYRGDEPSIADSSFDDLARQALDLCM